MDVHFSTGRIYQDGTPRTPREPSARFTKLIDAVMARHNTRVRADALVRGSQFSYIDLCMRGLTEHPICSGTEVIIFTSSSAEFDPVVPGIGASFLARFGTYELVAITNEGVLGGFTALDLAAKMVRYQRRNVCIIAIEQNTNPIPVDYDGFVPTENLLGILDVRSDSAVGEQTMLASGVVHKTFLRQKVESLAKTHQLPLHDLRLYLGGRWPDGVPEVGARAVHRLGDIPASSVQFIQYFEDARLPADGEPALLLLDDPFSANVGFVLMRREIK